MRYVKNIRNHHRRTPEQIELRSKTGHSIVAIEGLIPSGTMNDRRLSPSQTQPAPPPPLDRNLDGNFDRNQPSLADSLIPQALNRVPLSTDSGFHALLDPASSPRQPFSIKKGPFGRRR
jgi:hypothetical protein